MTKKSLTELVTLAAIWGSSFMFMRVGTPEFGIFLFMMLRTLVASVFLFPLLVAKKQHGDLTGHWAKLMVLGGLNTAIPFALFGYAILSLSAGVTSVLNATTPMFGALVAYFWLKDKLSYSASFGLLLGFAGVYFLVSDKLGGSNNDAMWPTLAVLGATLCYGIAASYTKVYFSHARPLALATGSQVAATIWLLPLGIYFAPDTIPSNLAIGAVICLGVLCTGIAYILFFRLIADLGPAKAISVTYLIPVFGILWGYLFLEEAITLNVIFGGLLILFGVGLTTGVIGRLGKKA